MLARLMTAYDAADANIKVRWLFAAGSVGGECGRVPEVGTAAGRHAPEWQRSSNTTSRGITSAKPVGYRVLLRRTLVYVLAEPASRDGYLSDELKRRYYFLGSEDFERAERAFQRSSFAIDREHAQVETRELEDVEQLECLFFFDNR
jgi:hypothetical protein